MLLMGDLNAKIGCDNRGYEEVMGTQGLGEMNENGTNLLIFVQQYASHRWKYLPTS